MMCRRILASVFVLCATLWPILAGSPFTKPTRHHRATGHARSETAATAVPDSVFCPPADSVAVAGFEKTLRSPRESMYITNNTSRPIESINLDIVYQDMDGRMMHRAEHLVTVCIPAHETRLVDVRSFDRQNLYYYYLSPAPVRAARATPFKVAVCVNYVTYPNQPEL